MYDMTLEERYEEIKQENINTISDYSESMTKSYEFGKFISNFITNFDFSIIDKNDCSVFVDELGEGISFTLRADFIKDIMTEKVSYSFCTKDNLKQLLRMCLFNCFGFYQRFNKMSPFVENSIREFVRGFKELNNHYANCVINCSNNYKYTPNVNDNLYPSSDIEVRLYNSYYGI